MTKKLLQAVLVVGMVGGLSACVTTVETEERLTSLEEKVNRALRDAAAAKIDATTALMISEEK